MPYETILVNQSGESLTLTMNRPQHRNSLNNTMLKEINEVLDLAEKNPRCRTLVLAGQPGFFCIGQDFEEAAALAAQSDYPRIQDSKEAAGLSSPNPYMATLKRFTLTPRVIISLVDGQAIAGGVGFAAASDLVIATPRSRFCLSEALWGLVPAIVFPFLLRRVGFQAAYRMMLTTMPISAPEAHNLHLIDEISENPQQRIHHLRLRLSRLSDSTIRAVKQLARKMWLITDQMEEVAVSESRQRFSDPAVIQNITNYVKYKKFPWDE
ncbi:MAG: enoyl-CoA hydratase/isomerase family protein [Candidatus Aminicenantes bacterium]|nr:MAG: enoyl-CoA hydratase/isomerase family protein [Candidatus Aminicenantes bacterium]